MCKGEIHKMFNKWKYHSTFPVSSEQTKDVLNNLKDRLKYLDFKVIKALKKSWNKKMRPGKLSFCNSCHGVSLTAEEWLQNFSTFKASYNKRICRSRWTCWK